VVYPANGTFLFNNYLNHSASSCHKRTE